MRLPFKRKRGRFMQAEIAPDEILLDSSNIPQFDTDQFEGRMERPLRRRSLLFLSLFFGLLSTTYIAQAWDLQVMNGDAYAERAQNNQLSRTIIFADRGHVVDRTGRPLATNRRPEGSDYSVRSYAAWRGIANLLGYARPPAKDGSGSYFREVSEGVSGIEEAYNDTLAGRNGSRLTETDALGKIISESALVPTENGEALTLSIDAAISQALFDAIAKRAEGSSFQGGAGVIMDVRTGELLALVSYPEYPLQVMADGTDTAAISALLSDKRVPFLDRALDGVYAPGSIVKPFVAAGALTEGVISEEKEILSTGSLVLPNPYAPDKPSIFRDWRAHGWVDMRDALAFSSDVYFYEIGGGFEDQKGLGIEKLARYFRLFGFGAPTGLPLFSESAGTVPTPAWKAGVFPDDPWRIGNTYHTAIGQYGMQVTPLQAARATAAIANGGELLTPTVIASSTPRSTRLAIEPHAVEVVKEGMRLAVTKGTAAAANVPFVAVAGKTGTAQVGSQNQYMNSWVTAFFPYENPRYAIAIVLEKAPAGTLQGAPAALLQFLTEINQSAPQYLQ